MKGWLRTLGLTALLAGQVLANEVEIVSDSRLGHLRILSDLYADAAPQEI